MSLETRRLSFLGHVVAPLFLLMVPLHGWAQAPAVPPEPATPAAESAPPPPKTDAEAPAPPSDPAEASPAPAEAADAAERDPALPAQEASEQPVLVPPSMLRFVEAQLPEGSDPGLSGKVVLSLEILDDGHVGEVLVLEGEHPLLSEAARKAGAGLLFEPATYDGKPVTVKVRFTYRFVPQVVEPPEAAEAEAEKSAAEAAPAPVDLSGQVLQRGTRTPLPGAFVRLGQGKDAQQLEVDLEGRFSIAAGIGKHRLFVEEPDHEPGELDVQVQEGQRTNVVVYLLKRSTDPYRTVIRSRRPRREVTRTVLEHREVTRVAGTFGEPFRVIEALPGLMRMPFTGGFLVVRGANPRDTGVFLDGHEIPLLYHFLVGAAVFQADLVRSIEFSPGNWSVRHGRRLGGLVEVRTKEERPERAKGQVELDLIDVGVMGAMPLGDNGDAFAAARRSHVDAIVSAVSDINVLPRYWDYQVGASLNLPSAWRGRLLAYGSDDSFVFNADENAQDDPGASNESAALGINFHRLLARAWRPLPGDGRIDISAALGRDNVGLSAGENNFDLVVWNLEGRVDTRWSLLDSLSFEAGLDTVYRRFDVDLIIPQPPAPWEFPSPGFSDERANFVESVELEQRMPAAYFSADWTPHERIQIIPGLRVDWFSGEGLNQVTYDPRLVLRAKAAEPLWLKGGVGLFHQPPEAFQVASAFGNTELSVPEALHISAGLELQVTEAFEIDVTGYKLERSELVSTNRSVQAQGGTVRQGSFDNERSERAMGVELMIRRRPLGSFFGWIAYTFSKTERRESSDRAWERHPFDQPHILTAVGSYRLNNDWEFGLRMRLVSGAASTPVVGSTHDSDTSSYRPIRGATRSVRQDPFFQVDLRVDRHFIFDTWMLNLYLDVLNVTNHSNSEFTTYNYDYSQQQTIPSVPIFPSIGAKGEF